jgi:hypothetical protein
MCSLGVDMKTSPHTSQTSPVNGANGKLRANTFPTGSVRHKDYSDSGNSATSSVLAGTTTRHQPPSPECCYARSPHTHKRVESDAAGWGPSAVAVATAPPVTLTTCTGDKRTVCITSVLNPI